MHDKIVSKRTKREGYKKVIIFIKFQLKFYYHYNNELVSILINDIVICLETAIGQLVSRIQLVDNLSFSSLQYSQVLLTLLLVAIIRYLKIIIIIIVIIIIIIIIGIIIIIIIIKPFYL